MVVEFRQGVKLALGDTSRIDTENVNVFEVLWQ
jgi:hypothetical protein